MKRLLFSLLMVGLLAASGSAAQQTAPAQAQARTRARVHQTCHAEIKWNYAANMRRGPGGNFGVVRQLLWHNAQMRVFGRDETDEWFQVELAEPSMLGWVWRGNINLFGNCGNLPVTDDNPEPETAPAPPPTIDLPAFARDLDIGEHDTLYKLNDGMLYLRHQRTDPLLQLHMVIADLTAPQLDVRVHVGAQPNVSAKLVSEMVADTGAMVAINGDFYAGNYMPQGLTIVDGQVITAPKFRASFAITDDHRPFIGYFTRDWTWPASVETEDGGWIPLQLMNLPCHPGWLCLYSDYIGGLPMRTGFDGLRVLLSPELEVLEIQEASSYMEVPPNHYVLMGGLYSSTGDWIRQFLEVGETVTLHLTTEPPWQQYEHAISGGPLIVARGDFYQDCDPSVPEEERVCENFDQDFRNQHYFDTYTPRTAVGFDAENERLFLVMVEGYEVDHSDGISQRALAEFFLRFGADWAMEFDGGGSSSMWVDQGFVNDFPPRGERRLSNALMLFWEDDSQTSPSGAPTPVGEAQTTPAPPPRP